MEKKGFMNISFGWLFALIVGAFVLFLAIFVSVKLIDISGTKQGAQVSKDLGIVFDPLETGFEESQTTILDVGYESKIENDCNFLGGYFGTQGLRTSQKIFGESKGGDVTVKSENKYIFSDKIVEDRYFYIFSRKFNLPFKVADLIFLIPKSQNYCFVSAPGEVNNLTNKLGLENVFNVTMLENCPSESEKICFNSRGCETKVDLQRNETTKNGENLKFIDYSTMFATIFSDSDVYECEMKRVVRRLSSLCNLYEGKKNFVKTKNCYLQAQLGVLENLANNYEDSRDLAGLKVEAEEIIKITKFARCQLW